MQAGTDTRRSRSDAPRLWPAVVLLLLLPALRWGPALVAEQTMAARLTFVLGPLVCALLILAWWLVASRVPVRERILVLLGLAVILAGTVVLSDPSMRQGFGIVGSVVPWGTAAFAVGFLTAHRLDGRRRAGVTLLVALVGFGGWTLVRSDGVWGDFRGEYHWRWQTRPEERILAEGPRREGVAVLDRDSFVEPDWPGFRGPGRDAVVPGITLIEDWTSHPPRELWRRPVGPAWSSFAVAGNVLFTQEQRGDDEVVVAYDTDTGAERWVRAYPSRFWESQGGVGPRATPTLSRGRLFTLGAEGLLHRLDPATGAVVWQADLREDAGREPPTWGFSSSPLVIDDLVVVHAGGEGDRGLLAYDAGTGELRWGAPAGAHGYSSPQLLTLSGRTVVAIVTDAGLTLVNPATGSGVWRYDRPFEYRILQPLLIDGASLLLNSRFEGTLRLDLDLADETIVGTERWSSRAMKSDFSDFVVHQGHLYGFDISIFACVDLDTGERRWKGGRYGHGQVLLLSDGGQLLITTETGDLVLVRADPERLDERGRIEVLDGKTWNHAALVGNRLYMRNGEEAVALELPTAP